MECKNVLVSVIIPTYERPSNLIRAINSVLSQDYDDIEIIVVDDNGINSKWQKETESILLDKIDNGEIKYICHEINKNGSAARNTGFKNSNGKYIIFLDDDDTLSEGRIQAGIKCLQNNENFDACYCDTRFVYGNKVIQFTNKHYPNPIAAILLGKMKFNTSSIIFKRKVLDELNGFDESFMRHQDYELYMRYFRNHYMIKSEGCYITKYQTPNVVNKNPLKSIDYREKLISTFKSDILSWPEGRKVISFQYIELARILAKYNYPIYAIKYILKASVYKIPSVKSIGGIMKLLFTSRI